MLHGVREVDQSYIATTRHDTDPMAATARVRKMRQCENASGNVVDECEASPLTAHSPSDGPRLAAAWLPPAPTFLPTIHTTTPLTISTQLFITHTNMSTDRLLATLLRYLQSTSDQQDTRR
jgi:hypothetical protein